MKLKRRYFEDYYSDNQYAVSIKEDKWEGWEEERGIRSKAKVRVGKEKLRVDEEGCEAGGERRLRGESDRNEGLEGRSRISGDEGKKKGRKRKGGFQEKDRRVGEERKGRGVGRIRKESGVGDRRFWKRIRRISVGERKGLGEEREEGRKGR
ncbi:hypothetical protein Tco_1428585 [Tanacetum coccineum]